MRRLVIDGANGFVGANLVARALLDDPSREVVTLSRGGPERMRTALDEAVVLQDLGATISTDTVRPVSYTLTEPRLGLDVDQLAAIFGAPCDYWHVAAMLDFSPMPVSELLATNVDGTRHAVDAFVEHAPPGSRFFQVSSAYSCGHIGDVARETWYPDAPPSAFRTYYESTKRSAELVVRDAIERHGIEAAIIRLGQVVGSAVSGRSTSDFGIYDFLRDMRRLTDRRPGEDVRIAAAVDSTLNLVPIDTLVGWLHDLAAADDLARLDSPIVHVVDGEAVATADFAAAVSRHLPVRLRIVTDEEMAGTETTLLERLVAARLSYSGRYVAQRIDFARDNLVALLGPLPPAVKPDVLDRIVGTFFETLDRTDSERRHA